VRQGVLAIVLESPAQRLEAVLEAVAGQTARVDAVLAVCSESARVGAERAGAEAVGLPAGWRTAAGFEAGLRAALGDDQRWLWLLDGSALPRPDALKHLLEPAEASGPLPTPGLVASRVILADGELDPSAAPWPRVKPVEVAIDAYQMGVVAIRTARHGSLLVAREAVAERGLTRVDYVADGDDVEWTGRLLRDSLGLYAPTSVVVRQGPAAAGDPLRELRNRSTMLFGAAFDAHDKRWLAVDLAERALAEARRGRPLGVLAALAEGVARGLGRQPAQAVPQPTGD
jgi:rhamnopyranosyl-N-acetylglucosaminyl-diphospho-decaprenol beta-1,3/1,4-galactofuranosyltransferase